MKKSITCSELKGRLAAGAVVVDVMTPEDYAACHLAGACNACIYEMVFPDRISEVAPDRDTELVLYDATGTRRTAELARERLLQAGYRKVSVLKGGLSALRAAGFAMESSGEPAAGEAEAPEGVYRVDTGLSRLEWTGRNLNNRHHGSIGIQSGEMVMAGGSLAGGSVVLDMQSIDNQDLQDPAWHDLLVRHLKSEDFFAVERFPTASFRFTGWEAGAGDTQEAPDGTVTGELTIKGITREVRFPAIVAPQGDGSIKAHALFDIDRTLWEVGYGSGKLFERLGMHLVHDMITLELFVLARRSP